MGTVTVTRDLAHKMKHTVRVRQHALAADEPAANGGEVAGIEVTVERDDSQERKGVYRLRATLALTGPLTEAQRQELLAVAGRCPVHKLMTEVTTEVQTVLAPASV